MAKHRLLTTAAALAAPLVLPISACSDEDRGDAKSGGPGTSETTAKPTTTAASDDDATSETAEATSTDDGPGQGGVPQDQDLDVGLRHPNGTTLTLSRLSFDGTNILIDAEVVNSGNEEMTIHDGGTGGDRLRLVDDAGENYNLVEAAYEETPFLDDSAFTWRQVG